MTVSEALATFAIVARVMFEACATLVVWISAYWQLVIVREFSHPHVELCGTGAAMFTFALAAFWGLTLLVLFYDFVQIYRGRLPRPMRWLRTVPAAAVVLLTPTLLFLA